MDRNGTIKLARAILDVAREDGKNERYDRDIKQFNSSAYRELYKRLSAFKLSSER